MKCYNLLNCVSTNNKNKEKIALIITDSNKNGCAKVTSVIKTLWNNSHYQLSTNSAQYLVSILNDNLSQHSSNYTYCNKSFNNLSCCLQKMLDLLKMKLIDVNTVLIASNDFFSSFQIIDHLQTMYSYQEYFLSHNVLLSGIFCRSYIALLPKGKSKLYVNSGYEGEWCGIIPFGNAAKVTTEGLHWNVLDEKLQFNGLVSTSNKLDGSGVVTINSDETVVWTIGLNCSDVEDENCP